MLYFYATHIHLDQTFNLKILKGHLWSRRRKVVKLCAGECVQLMQRSTNVFLLADWQLSQ